ncbi:MATE family efflux transporter [Cohnella soli]|uniref:MATE family efflux transporter n=1 Tax=Cohnella soli TaxID=425005 RepID=A0ABW0HQF1_9BACL
MKSEQRYGLWTLAWPIFIELLLQALLGMVDTIMVSRISDDAVAVVGLSGQLFNALTTLFMTIAGGAGILIAQKLGLRRNEDARTIAIMGFTASVAIGLVISVILYTQSGAIAGLLHVEEKMLPLWNVYVSHFGGGMFLLAMIASLNTAIRNTGNTRAPMYVGIGMNMLHIGLNYVFIFGKLGLPEWGLFGVTVSGNVSRLLASLVLFYVFMYAFDRKITWPDLRIFKPKLFREIVNIGWPMGVNMAGWVFSQLAIFAFIALLGTQELAARTYMNTLESFCFMLGASIAMAIQIRVAHLFGAGRVHEAYNGAFRALYIGLALVMANAALLYAVGSSFLRVFTSDPDILEIGRSLLAFNLILQPAKMLNMAMNNSLSAVGDTRFTMIVAIVSMSIVATGGSYWLGVQAGWGLIGIYGCMIADEIVRGTIVLMRWRGRKYLLRKVAERERSTSVAHRQAPSVQ